jgi:MFS transporter, MHS family, citrate/tricarballylate:H+ symporter
MMLTFTMMGASILGIALTPAYASIGLVAPVLVVFWRLLQGFALGGEVGPTTAFLIESAPPGQRALYGSLQTATQGVAVLAAGVIGVILAAVFDAPTLDSWGWRCAFLVGAVVVPVGLVIRRSLPETLHLPATIAEPAPDSGGSYTRAIVLGLCMLTAATIATYVRNYMTTYAVTTLAFSAHVGFVTTTIHGLTTACAAVAGGRLADRIGRRPVIIAFNALLALATMPVFLSITQFRTPAMLYAGMVVLATLSGMSMGALLAAVTESLPRRIRAGAVGTMYAVSVSIFGGSTQFMVAWIIGLTGSALVPGWYSVVASLLGLAAALAMREAAPALRSAAPASA